MYYVAHRLFALHDRALGALVAQELAANVGEEEVFLPFCDTDEEALVSPCKGRTLYDLDTERLHRLRGMIAVLHGPSLDDGVCMEIGYACRIGVPVVLATTDFQTYGLRPDGPELHFPDPLLETLAAHVVRVSRLAPGPAAEGLPRFETFLRKNLRPLTEVAKTAVARLLSCPPPGRMADIESSAHAAFVEPSPYLPGQAEAIIRQAEAAGVRTLRSQRAHPSSSSYEEIIRSTRADWEQLQRARLLIVDVNGPEAPPGAAVLIGASAADGRQVIALLGGHSSTFAPGREPNTRNLMIQYSVDRWCREPAELRGLLENGHSRTLSGDL
jgi:nucleoside 2-deoxyribosyltransferase